MGEKYFEMSVEDVEKYFDTSANSGLSSREAKKRIRFFGQNKIYDISAPEGGKRVLSLLFSPASLMFYASAAACVALHVSGALLAAVVWTVAVVCLALLKLWSASVLSAVYSCGIPRARVVRDGKPKLIDSRNLVPGDLILLAEGDVVCADCRIVYTEGIKVREPYGLDDYRVADKTADPCPEALSPSEMANIAYASSTVTYGGARATVTATGRDTLVLSDNGGNLLPLRGAHTCKTVEKAKKTERILCLISACALFFISIVLLVAAQGEPMEYFFISAATSIFWMCGACGVVAEFAVAKTVYRLSADADCRSVVKNIACLDMLADADVLICGEAFVQPFLPVVRSECSRLGLRVYVTAHPETAAEIAQACHGIVCATPFDAPDVKGDAPVVVVCRSPADRARLAASLGSAGHITAAVASKSGHIGMFNLSSVSFCCSAVELSARKITDISLEDIDRSAGNEAMMKNSDVLCRPTLRSVLTSISGSRALTRNVASAAEYACTVCAAMLITFLLTLLGSSAALTPVGAVMTAFPVALASMLSLSVCCVYSNKRCDAKRARSGILFGVSSALVWLAALVCVTVFAGELGFSVSGDLCGYCTCSLMLFAAFSSAFAPPLGSGAKGRVLALVPLAIAVALIAVGVAWNPLGAVLFGSASLYVLLLSAVPSAFAAGVSALNKAVYYKFRP